MMVSTYRSSAALGVLMAVSAGTIMAQPEQPKVRSVVFSTVKFDRIGDFLAASREFTEAVKKGGSEHSYSTWVSLSGPREYALVRYHMKWSELDSAPGAEPALKGIAGQLSALNARISATIESSRRVFYLLDHDLSLPLAPDATPQPIAQVLRTWVRPEHIEAYRTLVKSDLLAAAKKSAVKLYSVSHVRAGAANQEYSIVSGLDNFAALDEVSPIITGMGGQAAYDKFLGKLRALISRSEYEMYRYLPNQSYMAPKK
jgi:hypothetical protein